ncbi:MAG: hypothetical protein PUA61_01795 [Succinatimonas hippei]|nr:hypothetical protein [Succinatimonas hippei]
MTDERLKLKTEIKLTLYNLLGQFIGLCLLGSAGTLFVQITKENPNLDLLQLSVYGTIILTLIFGCIICLYINMIYTIESEEEDKW